jgi:hypothetical protein
MLNSTGRGTESIELYRKVLGLRTTLLGERHHLTAGSMVRLASILRRDGLLAEAESLATSGLEIMLEKLPGDHWEVANARGVLGDCYLALGRFREAEVLLSLGYSGLRAKRGDQDALTMRTLRSVIDLLQKTGRRDSAASLRRMLVTTTHPEQWN